ncbi:hypothetical protein ANCDUO_08649 [Ancylostoma duodenale]|uniref:Uncharacterized protein n=1 Tax=Ancylostoma duodenale TaxID=51022 RepID=A0A0C2GPU1_9BILA|nr:hypothetical protein ANCDUO_08649 [Ancylostoma duodenale]
MQEALRTRNPAVLIRAYKMYVCIVEFGTTIMSLHKKKDVMALESVQNNFTRKLFLRITGLFYAQIPCGEQRRMQISLPSLASRRKKFDLVMAYKMLTGRLNIKTESETNPHRKFNYSMKSRRDHVEKLDTNKSKITERLESQQFPKYLGEALKWEATKPCIGDITYCSKNALLHVLGAEDPRAFWTNQQCKLVDGDVIAEACATVVGLSRA